MFRHAYWIALIARRFGWEFSFDFTTAHEMKSSGTPLQEAMELYSDRMGRVIATYMDADHLADAVYQAVSSGMRVGIGDKFELEHSDDVPFRPAETCDESKEPGYDLPGGPPESLPCALSDGGYWVVR
nr:hypothetical protein [Saccharothrix sp. NRRL B-16348]